AAAAVDEGAVRDVFETVFDSSRPLDQRLALIEHGQGLRETIEGLPSEGGSLDLTSIRARGHSVRLHGTKAEVDFELVMGSARPLGQLVPFGIVVRSDGQWRVARYTVCAVVQLARRCPERDPSEAWQKYHMGERFPLGRMEFGRGAVPLTLPDGTSF